MDLTALVIKVVGHIHSLSNVLTIPPRVREVKIRQLIKDLMVVIVNYHRGDYSQLAIVMSKPMDLVKVGHRVVSNYLHRADYA